MQDGSVTVERRKRGPDVWCFRWREAGAAGRRIHRRIVLGTAEELKNIASARKMVTGLRSEININDIRIRRESIKLADLSRHFQQRELADRNPRISYSTKKTYAGYLEKWIEPRWGEYRFDAASIYRCGIENHAGTVASLYDSRDARYVHACGYE